MKITAWDLETSNLSASFGTIICAGYKIVGKGKADVINISQYPGNAIQAEKHLIKDLSKVLLTADCWLTWFGTYFDIPYLNTRLLYHHLPTLPANYAHIDGWKTAKNRLRLGNNRLNTVQQFLNLTDEKTHIKGEMWIRAVSGYRTAMRYLTDHCRKDVLVLEEAYERLKPLILDHPSHSLVSGKDGCGVCGSVKLQKRGFHITRTRKFQRLHCQECGSWSRSVKPLAILS